MKKNVLHIIYQTNIIWWVENFLSTLLSFSKNEDILVQVYDKENKTWIKNKIINLSEKIHSYNPIILLYQTFSRALKYKRISNTEKIDISVSHWDSLNLSNILSKILFWNKSKVYIFLHNSLSFYTNKWSFVYKYLFNFFYPKADKVITISKEMGDELKEKWYTNIETLYNPIDFEKIEVLKTEKLWEYKSLYDKKTFIIVSRLEKVKNIDFLIDSFIEFNKTNENFNLIIVWTWSEENNLIKKAKDISNIHFIWFQKNFYKFLYNSDYFLFWSNNEWFWRALIESLSCNTPILTHDFKYWAKEIIRNNNDFSKCINMEIHENWILIPYLNKKLFISGMEKLSKISFDKKIIRNNIETYNLETQNKKWELILNK